jgi:hypothetical protein
VFCLSFSELDKQSNLDENRPKPAKTIEHTGLTGA